MARQQAIEAIDVLLEAESQPLDIYCWDENDEPAAPNQFYYRVIDPVNNSVIRDDTNIPTPGAMITILLTVPDTQIVDNTKHKEKRRVICVAEFAGGEKTIDTYDFHVRNVKTLLA